jgi:hypothetical protein
MTKPFLRALSFKQFCYRVKQNEFFELPDLGSISSFLSTIPIQIMTFTGNDPLDFINGNTGSLQPGSQTDLVQQLLYEIIRVKELIKYYDTIPNGAGQLGSSILNELVTEAYNSLVNYDVVLMQKYYDLLLNCD